MLPDDDYLLVMPSLAIINDKLDEAAALMKSHSEPCKLSGLDGPQLILDLFIFLPDAQDDYFTKQITRTQLSMNISHLMAIIIVPMISVLSVKTFNYN